MLHTDHKEGTDFSRVCVWSDVFMIQGGKIQTGLIRYSKSINGKPTIHRDYGIDRDQGTNGIPRRRHSVITRDYAVLTGCPDNGQNPQQRAVFPVARARYLITLMGSIRKTLRKRRTLNRKKLATFTSSCIPGRV